MPAAEKEGGWEVEVRLGPLDPPLARRLVLALQPESLSGVPGSGTEVREGEDHAVVVVLKAPGTPGVRAALNSHLRWVDLALRTDVLASQRSPSRGVAHP